MRRNNILFEKLIRKQDPRFIDWNLLALDERLSEELVREYNRYISRFDMANIYLHQGFSDDFIKEFNLEWLESE